MLIYVIIAYRWNSQEGHSYLVTAKLNKQDAIDAAEFEADERGGKYSCRVYEVDPNVKYEGECNGVLVYTAKGIEF